MSQHENRDIYVAQQILTPIFLVYSVHISSQVCLILH